MDTIPIQHLGLLGPSSQRGGDVGQHPRAPRPAILVNRTLTKTPTGFTFTENGVQIQHETKPPLLHHLG